MPTASELTNNIKQKLNEDISDVHIYTGVYKIGPARREQTFTIKTSPDTTRLDRDKKAQITFNRYVEMLKSRENQRIVQIGHPSPFAVDVDEEIERYNQQRKSAQVGAFVPNPPVAAG